MAMRKIVIGENTFFWKQGKIFVKIVCKEIKYNKIFKTEDITQGFYYCEDCYPDMCSYARIIHAATPKDIRKIVLETLSLTPE